MNSILFYPAYELELHASPVRRVSGGPRVQFAVCRLQAPQPGPDSCFQPQARDSRMNKCSVREGVLNCILSNMTCQILLVLSGEFKLIRAWRDDPYMLGPPCLRVLHELELAVKLESSPSLGLGLCSACRWLRIRGLEWQILHPATDSIEVFQHWFAHVMSPRCPRSESDKA